MQVRNINNRQNFGMKIPHTDALGEVIHYWRKSGLTQKDINKNLTLIKRTLPDTFEFKVKQFQSSFDRRSAAAKYSFIFKDGKTYTENSIVAPYNFIKNIKNFAKEIKDALIKEKGQRAVTGRGIY